MLAEAIRMDRPLQGIQYLRAVAALMVVAHHAQFSLGVTPGEWSGFGSRGVDIFFVISGFIMAYVTRRPFPDVPRWVVVREFLSKRCLRIVPLYWMALAWAAHGLILGGGANADLLRDFLFLPHYPNGVPGQPVPYLVPGWTINYEVFFYLVFGLAMLAGTQRYRVLFLVFGCLIAAGFLFDVSGASWTFYTNQILAEFLCGVLLYFIAAHPGLQGNRWLHCLGLAGGAAGLYVASEVVDQPLLFGPAAALLVWGATHLLQGYHNRGWLLLGDASYALYLFHPFALGEGTRILRKLGLADPDGWELVLGLGVQLAFAVVVAITLHRVLEKPLLRAGQRLLPLPPRLLDVSPANRAGRQPLAVTG